MTIPAITAKETSILLAKKAIVLVDVREAYELDICRIDGAVNIPLSEFEKRRIEIPRDKEVVLFCRSGGRSGRATLFLQSKGYTTVKNMDGGVLAWARDVDPSLRTY